MPSASALQRFGACVAIALLLAGVTSWMAPRGWFERVDGIISDLAFPRGEADPGVLVVAIDDTAMATVDPTWPWPRERQAELVDRLADAGAAVVVLDLVHPATDEGDDALVTAMGRVPTVVAASTGTVSGGPGAPLRLGRLTEPTPAIGDAAAAVGHAQVVAGTVDGVVRTLPLVAEAPDGRLVPSLALAALAVREDPADPPRPILRRPGGVQVGTRLIPTDDRYRLRVSWPDGLPAAGGGDAPAVGATEVLLGRVGAGEVGGRVVFVGATDPTLGDRISTPVTRQVADPGVMAHAAAYDTLTSRRFLDGPSTAWTALAVLALALLTALVVQFGPVLLAALAVPLLAVGALLVPVLSASAGTLLHSPYPPLAVALAVPLSGSVRYLTETRLRRRVSDLFARYVPPPVAEQLLRDGRVEEVAAGRRLEVTVFFCDLRGFTPLAAELEPASVNRLLSRYYEYVSAEVLAAGGTIIQYVGDEVFAVFGAPIESDDHATAALNCALSAQAGRARLSAALAAEGLPDVGFGIGLHSGPVVAAHAGSSFRRQYTVVGDTVNVGARLCAQAAAGEVVAGGAVGTLARDRPEAISFTPELKGVDRPTEAARLGVPASPVHPRGPG